MIDTRREAYQIHRQFERFHQHIGEGAVWFLYDAENSAYDRVYDEGYRKYELGRKIPLLWVDQQESAADYSPEGRRPTQRIRMAFGAMQMWEAGIDVTEAHGNAIDDRSPSTIWRRDRINDIVYYGQHFYAISGFQIKGRIKDQDVIIGVSGIEIFPNDELNLDVLTPDWYPPITAEPGALQPVADNRSHVVFGGQPPTAPDIGDFWFNPTEVITDYALDSPLAYGGNAPEGPEVGSFWLDTEEQ